MVKKPGKDKFPSPILAPDFEVRTNHKFWRENQNIEIWRENQSSKFGGKFNFKIWREIKILKFGGKFKISAGNWTFGQVTEKTENP